MDPLSSLAVAAAALEFLNFGLKTIRVYRTIRADAQDARPYNAELLNDVRRLKDLAAEVGSSVSTNSNVSIGLVNIAKNCTSKAEELTKLLDELSPAPNPKFLEKATAAFKLVRSRSKIDKLSQDLEKERNLLVSYELAGIRQNMTSAYLQQKQATLDIRADLNTLGIKLKHESALIQLEQSATQQSILDRIEDLSIHISDLLTAYSHGVLTSIKNVQDTVDQGFKNMALQATVTTTRDALLRSLFFEQQFARKENLPMPLSPATYNWLYGPLEPTVPGKTLRSWLTSGSSLYWVQGKAGSGKSTLMKYVVDHSETWSALKNWAGQRELITASFFFWRAGSALEQSVTGLLRSLLYQICKQNHSVTSTLIGGLCLEDAGIPSWSEPRLRLALHEVLHSTNNAAFCLFIDGLDEYNGDYLDLLDLIRDIHPEANVKICVSSRPEIEFLTRLRDCPQLCLHKHNYPDIYDFVSTALRDYPDGESMASRIATRAEGVFLWAVMVSQYVRRGLVSQDKHDTLSRRIDELPGALHDLYSQMMGKVDAVHLDDLRFYIKVLQDHHAKDLGDASVALIAAARLDGDIVSYDHFARECQYTSTQIVACSRGLLGVSRLFGGDNHADSLFCIQGDNDEDTRAFTMREQGEHRLKMVQSRRQQQPVNPSVKEFYVNEDKLVSFVHRSAYEFLLHSAGVWSSGLTQDENEVEFENRSLTAYLRLLIAGPHDNMSLSLPCRFHTLVRYAASMRPYPSTDYENPKFVLLDQAIEVLNYFIATELLFVKNRQPEFGRTVLTALNDKTLLDYTHEPLRRDHLAGIPILDYLASRTIGRDALVLRTTEISYITRGLAEVMNDPKPGARVNSHGARFWATDTEFMKIFAYFLDKLISAIGQPKKSDHESWRIGVVKFPVQKNESDRTLKYSWCSDGTLTDEENTIPNILYTWYKLAGSQNMVTSLSDIESRYVSLTRNMRRTMDDLNVYLSIAPVDLHRLPLGLPRKYPRLCCHIPATSFTDMVHSDSLYEDQRTRDFSRCMDAMRLVAWVQCASKNGEESFPGEVICHQDLDADTISSIAKHSHPSVIRRKWPEIDTASLLSTKAEFDRSKLALLDAVWKCKSYTNGWHQIFMAACVSHRLEDSWTITDSA